MIKCMSCNGDMIYQGKGSHDAFIETYIYTCYDCKKLMWTLQKEKSKYKWYKLSKENNGRE